ncbi:MAG: hypothetical protein WA888_12500 [Burkholderiaceae bacterium]
MTFSYLTPVFDFLAARGASVPVLALIGALVIAWIFADFYEEHFR